MKISDKKLTTFRNLVEQGHYDDITSKDIRNEFTGEYNDAVLNWLENINDGKNCAAAAELVAPINQPIAINDRRKGEDNFIRYYDNGL